MLKITTFFLLFYTALFLNSFTPVNAHEKESDEVTQELKLSTTRGAVHFEIHGLRKDKEYINRVTSILENDAKPILNYFEYPPTQTIHFVLNDFSSSANGSARTFPGPIITLNTFPPLSNSHLILNDDWLKGLVLHELTHIVHLDQTRGFIKGVGNIFGRAGHVLTSVLPRWFVEGIAVWAETEFSLGGRLSSDLLKYELEGLLLDDKQCQTIDCIDSPGVYPFGSNAYWMGSQFIDYIEKSKPGMIKCWVHANSSLFPFLLSKSFSSCFGENLSSTFKKFIQEQKEDIKSRINKIKKVEVLKNFELINLKKKGIPLWQKNWRVGDGALLFSIEGNKGQGPRFAKWNFDKKTTDFLELEGFVEDIAPFNKGRGFPISYSTYARFNNPRKIGWFFEGKLQKGEIYGDYPLGSEKGIYFFRFENSHWNVYLKERQGKERLIYELPKLIEIQRPQLLKVANKEMLSFQAYRKNSNRPYQLWAIDQSGEKGALSIQSIYDSASPFELLGVCTNKVVLKSQKNELRSLEYTPLAQVRHKLVQGEWIKQIVQIRWDLENTVAMIKDNPRHLYRLDKGCDEVISEVFAEPLKEIIKRPRLLKKKVKVAKSKGPLKSYPRLKHLTPNWWFLNFFIAENASRLGAMTSLEDPKGRHQLGVGADYYFIDKSVGPRLSYTYNFKRSGSYLKPDSPTSLGVAYSKSFVNSNFRRALDENEVARIFLAKSYRSSWFSFSPQLSYSRQNQSDTFGDRELGITSFSHNYFFSKLFRQDFFQSGSLNLMSSYQTTQGGVDFWSHRGRGTFRFQLPFATRALIQTGYGKLVKNRNFSSGLLFSGGFETETFFPFYGVDLNDAVGNEVFNYRLQFDWSLFNINRGRGVTPLFLKRINLVLGTDFLKTDFIFIDINPSSIREARGVHGGVRIELDAFYALPISVDILANQSLNSFGNNQLRALGIVRGAFFF